jgi:hypothetical protein
LAKVNDLKCQNRFNSDEFETQKSNKKANDVQNDCCQHRIPDRFVSSSILSHLEGVIVTVELKIKSLSLIFVLGFFVIERNLALQAFNVGIKSELDDHFIVLID